MKSTITKNGFTITKTPCPMVAGYFYLKVKTPSGLVVKFEGFKASCVSFLRELVEGV